MSYRIKTVAELVGVPRNTLIAWERRHGIPRPYRADNGYRLYSPEEVALLRRVKSLLDSGLRISEAVDLVRAPQVDAPPPAATARDLPPVPVEHLRNTLRDALMAYDRSAADAVTSGLSVHSFEWTIQHVYFPILHEVGDGWVHGRVSVAQEHYVSSYLREKLLAMMASLHAGPHDGPLVLCATPFGEFHELALLATAVRLAAQGWRVAYLGPNMPADELARMFAATPVRMVCVSASWGTTAERAREYAEDLVQAAPLDIVLVFGGPEATVSRVRDLPRVHVYNDLEAFLRHRPWA